MYIKKISVLIIIISFVLAPIAPIFAQETQVDLTKENSNIQDSQVVDITNNSPEQETTINNSEEIVQTEIPETDNPPIEEPNKEEEIPPAPENMQMNNDPTQEFNPDNLTTLFPKNQNSELRNEQSSGALNYVLKIETPPGRNNIEPSLKLEYNNQKLSNTNIFGYGWEINIPYIERLNKTGTDKLYTDNYFTSSLSGELVLVSGNTYAPKIEDGRFLTYTYDGTYWTVKDKNGTVYKFGTNASERQDDPNNSSKMFKWMLEEERDTNDNYIKYEYYKDQGQIYPSKIRYTGNGNDKGVFEVIFKKEERTDINKSYASTFLVKTKYRINEILVKVRGSWVKKYNLNYITGDNGSRSLLSSVTESGQSEDETVTTLPSIDFEYYDSTPNWTETNSQFTSPIFMGNGTENFLDINGDALPDIIESYNTVANPIKNTYINNNNGTWSVNSSFQPPLFFKENEVRSGWGDQWDQGVRLGDVNGDLLPDMIKSEENSNNNGGYDAYINSGSSWDQNNVWNPTTTINGDNNTYAWGTYFIDLNNDGIQDIIRNFDETTKEEQINNGNNFNAPTNNWNTPVSLRGPWAQMVELNGDGLPDIVYKIMINYNTQTIYKAYLNKGNGEWIEDNTFLPIAPITDNASQDTGVRFFDVNNDGLLDAVSQFNSLGGGNHGTYLNNGQGWLHSPAWNVPDGQINFNQSSYVGITDLNTDGSLDFITTQNGSPMITRAFINNTNKPTDTLKKVKYSQGGSAEIVYKKSSKYIDNTNNLLNPDLPIALDTVNQIITKDENNNILSTETYSYEGGEYYFNTNLDRKFAGFNKVTKTDSVGNKTITYYYQGNTTDSSNGEYSDHSSKIGKIYRQESYDANNNFYDITINKWDRYNQGTNRDFVKLVRSTQLTYDGDSDHKDKAFEYAYDDDNGNIIEKISFGEVNASNNGNFTDTGTDKYTQNISYASNTNDYIVGLVKQDTLIDQNSNKVRESKTYYDDQPFGQVLNGNITKVEKWKDNTNYVNTQKTYDTTYGLPLTSTDERGNVTTYTYDNYKLYPEIIENPLNQIIKYFYDYASGKVKQKIDLNNQVFKYKYDGLGRLLEEKISTTIGEPEYPVIKPVLKSVVVAGGGAGGGNANGSHSGGGGGAGGLIYEYFTPLDFQNYTITIGKGGRGGYGVEDAEDSTFAYINSERGGRGGTGYEPASNGGSGGGSNSGTSFGLGIEGQGNNGGIEVSTYMGGGGGAGLIGGDAGGSNNSGGNGGDGIPNPILGSNIGENINGVYYLAGGGAGYGYNQGFGGKGGGGDGAYSNCAGNSSAGLENTGGGGGGACWGGYGSNGGSGVVILSYATDGSDGISNTSTGGSITTYGNQTIHTFTTSGVFNLVSSHIPSSNPPVMSLKSTYTYNDTQGAISIHKTDYLDDTNTVDTYQYFDGLNRLVQERKEMESVNEYATRDIKYNSLGLIEKESLPYTSSGTAKTSPTTTNNLYKNYTYDPLYRISTTSDNIGTTTNTYDDWKTSVVDPNGNLKHYYKDAYDNLAKVEEINDSNTYTTTYEWNGNQLLTKITDALGNIRNFTYDALGRRLIAEDLHNPSDTEFGIWNYSYDDASNLIQSQNPNGDVVDYTYNEINQILSEDSSSTGILDISYTYSGCDNGEGRVCRIDMEEGPDAQYSYDALGNVSIENKNINGINFATLYLYDRQGNLLEITYPDNTKTKNIYNSAGQLESIQKLDPNETIYDDVILDFDYGPHGKVIYQENENGIITQKTYDADKLYRLVRIHTTDSNTNNLQDLNYSYDANNNITQIIDASNSNTSKTVNYTYDDLNRLFSAAATNVANGQNTYTENYTYDAIGNILTGPQGIYTYGNSGFDNPHAVTTIDNTSYVYDNNGNLRNKGEVLDNTWNYKNQLLNTRTPEAIIDYLYDHAGDRVLTTKDNENTYFINKYSRMNNDESFVHNIYASDMLVATIKGEREIPANSSDTDYKSANNIISNTGWANFTVSRLAEDDSARATCNGTCDDNDNGQIGDFNFDITSNASIDGIEVLTDMSMSIGPVIVMMGLSPDNGATWADYKKFEVSETTDALHVIGADNDTWGRTWTPSELSNANFRLHIDKDPTNSALRVDQVLVKVYYHTPLTTLPAEVEYIHTDHLNSTNVSTNQSGTTVSLLDYYPYGGLRIDDSSNSMQSKKYTGYQFDADTGLNYANARYYSADIGKFISQDPTFLSLGDAQKTKENTGKNLQEYLINPQTLNSYSYTGNNPINRTDPNGKDYVEANLSINFQPFSGNLGFKVDFKNLRLDYTNGIGFSTGYSTDLSATYNFSDLPDSNKYVTTSTEGTFGYGLVGKGSVENTLLQDKNGNVKVSSDVGSAIGVGIGGGLSGSVTTNSSYTIIDYSRQINQISNLVNKISITIQEIKPAVTNFLNSVRNITNNKNKNNGK